MKVDMHSHKSKHEMAAIPSFCTVGWERHGWDCTNPGSVLTNSQDMASPALKLFRCKKFAAYWPACCCRAEACSGLHCGV